MVCEVSRYIPLRLLRTEAARLVLDRVSSNVFWVHAWYHWLGLCTLHPKPPLFGLIWEDLVRGVRAEVAEYQSLPSAQQLAGPCRKFSVQRILECRVLAYEGKVEKGRGIKS